MDRHRHGDGGGGRLVGFHRHQRGEFPAAFLSHTGNTLKEFTKILRFAADQLVWTGEVPDEMGGTELGDGRGWMIEGVERESTRSFNIHPPAF